MNPDDAVPFVLADGSTTKLEKNLIVNRKVDPAEWVDEHGDFLFRFAMLRLGDVSLAEDAVQETLLSAIKAVKSYAENASERTWLVGILKHKIIDHYRKNKGQVQLTEEDTDLSATDRFFERPDEWNGHWARQFRPVDPGQSPADVVEREEFWEAMRACLSELPDRVASVFTLREIDDRTSAEICDALDLSAGNFWVIMHRARMQLRRCMEIKWFSKAI